MRDHAVLSLTVGYVAYHLTDDLFLACVLSLGSFILPYIDIGNSK